MERIRHSDDLETALIGLFAQDPAMAAIAAKSGAIALRLMPGGFAGLADIVTGQLISRQAARAIFSRLQKACTPLTPENYLALSARDHIAIGLTRAKQVTLAGIAEAIVEGRLDLAGLHRRPADIAEQELLAFRGIGQWTADIYLMFCCGHGDIFPAGDMALRAAAEHAFQLDSRPSVALLKKRAEAWAPFRSAAARVLWAYYAQVMKKDVLPVG